MIRSSYIRNMPRTPGSEVKVAGWVERVKELKNARFIWLADRTATVQVTLPKDKVPESLFKIFDSINPHDFLAVKGVVPDEIRAKAHIEIIPSEITILSKSEKVLPLNVTGIGESDLDTRMNWRPISLRNSKMSAILKIESCLVEGMQKFLIANDFMLTFTPSILGSPAEGGAEVFPVVYYNKTAYLRQDPQLHRQLLMLAGLDRIYEIGPSWRAELSRTTRHLSEHRTCAAELSFIDDEYDVMHIEEGCIQSGIKEVKEKCKEELEVLGKDITVPTIPFPVLKFPDIYELLKDMGKKLPYGEDMDHESEILLAKHVKEKYKSDFFFVNRFPFKVKPFYVMRVDDDPEWARSVDLIYKGIELSSGGQREHRYDKIIEQAKEKGMNLENISWFSKYFKYGAPSHGGFSIGIERITMQLLDMQNILETVPFPRTADRFMP